jgi:endonuclease/exonuclease/phosphatase family metal-dependent hydrolase
MCSHAHAGHEGERMADTFRLATFNVENLFARYRFRANADAYASDDGFTVNQLAFDIYDEPLKRITGQAVRELNADILCLQEVESLEVLDRFVTRYLPDMGYKHRMLIDCHDPRHIDVGVLSRKPIVGVRTHRHERSAHSSAPLFSRDCLQVDVQVVEGKQPMTLYVNHFKSMMEGRDATRPRREEQVKRVAAIVDQRWRDSGYDGNFAVLGDFNDYIDAKTSLSDLVSHKALGNIVDRLPQAEQWTHFYGSKKEYKQLDYILLPSALDKRAGKPAPVILRKGLPWRAEKYTGLRYEGVGEDDPKASDHAPVAVDIPLKAIV